MTVPMHVRENDETITVELEDGQRTPVRLTVEKKYVEVYGVEDMRNVVPALKQRMAEELEDYDD